MAGNNSPPSTSAPRACGPKTRTPKPFALQNGAELSRWRTCRDTCPPPGLPSGKGHKCPLPRHTGLQGWPCIQLGGGVQVRGVCRQAGDRAQKPADTWGANKEGHTEAGRNLCPCVCVNTRGAGDALPAACSWQPQPQPQGWTPQVPWPGAPTLDFASSTETLIDVPSPCTSAVSSMNNPRLQLFPQHEVSMTCFPLHTRHFSSLVLSRHQPQHNPPQHSL